MAYSGDNIDSSEVLDAAADLPLFWATHILRDAKGNTGFTVRWRTDGDVSSADQADSNYSTRAAYDEYLHTDTRPNASGAEWWLVADAGTSSVFTAFDCLLVRGNFADISATAVEFYVSDNADVKTNGTKIADFGAPSNNRLVSIDMDDEANDDPQRFTDARFIGLKVTGSSITPRVFELWAGRRRQLPVNFLRGHNPDAAESDAGVHSASSGVETVYVRLRDRHTRDGGLITDGTSEANVLLNLYSDRQDGTAPMVMVENPNSAPSEARVMRGQMRVPGGSYDSADLRSWQLALREQAPFYDREGS